MLFKINNPTDYKVAIYIRLSKEDEDKKEESQSVTNQRSLITDFIKENNLNLVDTYTDDGVSETTSDRPQFNKMIEDINNKKINMVITKDLSRLGRYYIKTGYYLERFFPENRIKYISLLDKIDSVVKVLSNCIDIMLTELINGNTDFSFQLGDVTFTHPKSRVCGIGTNSVAVSHNGDVGTCGMDLVNTFANVHKDNIFESLHTSYSNLLNTSSNKIDGCKDCVWKYSCANACPKQTFATYGRYDVVSPYCEIYKELIPKLLDLYAYQIWQKSTCL